MAKPRERERHKVREGGREGGLLLSALSTDCNPLAVRRPGDVANGPRYWLVLILQDVLLLCGVPDPDLTRHICTWGREIGGWSLAQKATPTSRCNVESAGCVASDGGVHRVLCIYVSYSWVLGRQVSSVVVKQEKETSHPSLRNETYHTHTGTIMKPLLSKITLESPPTHTHKHAHSLLLT